MLLKEKMLAAGGRPSGFDYLRLALALSIVATHFLAIVGSNIFMEMFHTLLRPFAAMLVPMFIALSGFLVSGSLARNSSLLSFLGLRVLRIVPALAFDVVLCAFILGPYFTRLSLKEYFTDPLFYGYFLNIIGDVHFFLPGVFSKYPNPMVMNSQLWTIPWELCCYLLIATMSLVAVFRSRLWLVILTLAIHMVVFYESARFPPILGGILVPGIVLVEAFLSGIIVFVFADRLRHEVRLFRICLLTMLVLLFFHVDFLVSLPLTYVTVYLGLLNPRRNKIALSGDYSYGIYLYGWPILQLVTYVNGPRAHWAADMLYVFSLTLFLAAISWWLVERPALSLRKYLPLLDRHRLG